MSPLAFLHFSLLEVSKTRLYNILFESATIALKQILSKKEYMGADKIGLVAILHTWGSNLSYHPHLHTCVAGCGLDKKGNLVLAKNKNYLCNANQLQQIYGFSTVVYTNNEP